MSEYAIARTLKRGDSGPDVKLLQEWLCLDGTEVGVDSQFGPATAAACQRVLSSDVVTPVLFEKLTAPMRYAIKPIEELTEKGERIVAAAKLHLDAGARELPRNSGPWVRLYCRGRDGQKWAWCAGFASYVLRQALGTPAIPYTESCDAIATAAQRGGLLYQDPLRIRAGHLFLVRKSPIDWIHTGIVISASNDAVVTIEGNSDDMGSREGTRVVLRVRAIKPSLDFVATY